MDHVRRYRINDGPWLDREQVTTELAAERVRAIDYHIIESHNGRHFVLTRTGFLWLHAAWSDALPTIEAS